MGRGEQGTPVRLLLDTNVLIWRQEGRLDLIASATETIRTADELLVSVVSFVEIGIKADGRAEMRIEKIEMKERQGRFEIKADQAPAEVTIDPNRWVLMKSSFQGVAVTK